jgi:L-cysteate sulfo-lyase
MKLSKLPRIRLASLPTPLQEMPNLSKELGPRILVKRDDLTGLAFGGNKARKLEYLMGDVVAKGSDYIITGAGFHSNWCTQTVAAARRLGLKISLVKKGPKAGYDPEDYDGNHLLHVLMGADIRVVRPENFEKTMIEVEEAAKTKGYKTYSMGIGGSNPVGASGYVNCMLELVAQSVEMGIDIDYLIHCSGSGGTQAGLVAGAKALNSGIKVVGIGDGDDSTEEQIEKVSKIVNETFEFLEIDAGCKREDIMVFDQYGGEDYGFMTEGKAEAIRMLAEKEGLFLDPVYTGSAMWGLISLCREGFFKREDTLVFLHTGGPVALFPYRETLKAHIRGAPLPWVIPEWSTRAG